MSTSRAPGFALQDHLDGFISSNALLLSRGAVMSSDLKSILKSAVEEDYRRKVKDIEERLERYGFLILKIEKLKKLDLAVFVEGEETHSEHEKDLSLLEKGNLVEGQMKYTERNAYLEYTLTKKGVELAKKLSKKT